MANTEAWSHEEERALLLIRANEEICSQIQGTSRDAEVYRLIAGRMVNFGYNRNRNQVKNKLKYLRAKWQRVVYANNKSGSGKKYFVHEELCHSIWGHRPSTRPLNLVSSIRNADDVDDTSDAEDEPMLQGEGELQLQGQGGARDHDDDDDELELDLVEDCVASTSGHGNAKGGGDLHLHTNPDIPEMEDEPIDLDKDPRARPRARRSLVMF